MLNTSKLSRRMKIDIALNAGVVEDDDVDTATVDEAIAQMTPEAAIRYWFGWHLGSREWGELAMSTIDAIRAAKVGE